MCKSAHPYIDESDPNNPIFRLKLSPNHEAHFSIRQVDPEYRHRIADRIANAIQEAYQLGQTSERAKIQNAIRSALML